MHSYLIFIMRPDCVGYIDNGMSPGVLISPYPDQEGNKLMFLSEWREFPSAPCLSGKETW